MNVDKQKTDIINRESKKAGLRGRVDAKCCECIYDNYSEGTWRKQVEDCSVKTCPLWKVRPQTIKFKS
jgi:hypothetical protein